MKILSKRVGPNILSVMVVNILELVNPLMQLFLRCSVGLIMVFVNLRSALKSFKCSIRAKADSPEQFNPVLRNSLQENRLLSWVHSRMLIHPRREKHSYTRSKDFLTSRAAWERANLPNPFSIPAVMPFLRPVPASLIVFQKTTVWRRIRILDGQHDFMRIFLSGNLLQ